MRKLLMIASLLLYVGTAHAEPFSNMGVGAQTCAQFVAYYRADAATEQRFFDWAQGLMSGINDALEDTVGKYRDLNSMPIAQQKEILRAFCLNRPTAKYGDAVNSLLSRLPVVPSTLKGAPAHPLQR
jgi:hypothetical protein